MVQTVVQFRKAEGIRKKRKKTLQKKAKRQIKQVIALRKVSKRTLRARQKRAIITEKVISPRHKADLIRPQEPFALVREGLESTAIAKFDFDPFTLTMKITFWRVRVRNKVIISKRPGGTYLYFEVPSKTHIDFIRASSKGRFFNANIRGRFSFSKIG